MFSTKPNNEDCGGPKRIFINFFLHGYPIVLVVNVLLIPVTYASPCYPNDPGDSNPGNLCLSFPPPFIAEQPEWMPIEVQPAWSPIPNQQINQSAFIKGTGTEAYYGYPVSPIQPGQKIGSSSGFWTNIEATNGTTTITDSNGHIIKAN